MIEPAYRYRATAIFSAEALNRVIKETLPMLPPGKKSAVVGMVDQNGVKVAAIFEVKEGHVEIHAAFEQDWDGDHTGGAKIIASW